MQTEESIPAKKVPALVSKESSKESLYRTKWLMAHNRLHRVVHDSSTSPVKEWSSYLAELQTAWDVAEQ